MASRLPSPVAYLYLELAPLVPITRLAQCLGFEPGIDHNDVVADFDDDAGNDRARLQFGNVWLCSNSSAKLSVLIPSCLKTTLQVIVKWRLWSTC